MIVRLLVVGGRPTKVLGLQPTTYYAPTFGPLGNCSVKNFRISNQSP